MKNKRYFFYPIVLVFIAVGVHFWVTQPLFWEKIPYRLNALGLAVTSVNCDKAAPAEMSNLLRYHSLPNFALTGHVVYVDQGGRVYRCGVSPNSSEVYNYRLASMTKVITAHITLKLADRGILDPSAPFLDYFPEVDINALRDPRLRQVTIFNLVNHSSGFGGFFGSDDMVKKGVTPWCPNDFKRLESVRLAGVPGTNHVYSNVAYCLLGEIIARVTQAPYRQYVRDNYLSGTDLRFVDGDYLPDEPDYDFSNDYLFKRDYVKWLNFKALSSAAGLMGRPDEFARVVWEKVHTDVHTLLGASLVPECGRGKVSKCYSWNFELELDHQGRVLAGVQQGYMPGVTSMLAITPDGQVLVWVAAGAAIEGHHKDGLKEAIVNFLVTTDKDSELTLPEAA